MLQCDWLPFHAHLDKREDVLTLRNLGADDSLIVRIFLFEGRLISLLERLPVL